jgi:hypothetical protein
LPDLRDIFQMGVSPTLGLAAKTGSRKIQVTNMPSHNHGISDPGHGHGIGDPSHYHTMRDVAIPYGSFVSLNPNAAGGIQETNSRINTDWSGTGIWLGAAGTGIWTNNVGGNQDYLPPSVGIHQIIRII